MERLIELQSQDLGMSVISSFQSLIQNQVCVGSSFRPEHPPPPPPPRQVPSQGQTRENFIKSLITFTYVQHVSSQIRFVIILHVLIAH